jgi:enoyl-CoA hydratase/carnithine racemase
VGESMTLKRAHCDFIAVEQDGRLTIVTLNRPEVHNALHAAAHAELERAFEEFEQDEEQWVAIVTGAGDKAFCAGNDLRQQAAGVALASPQTGFAGLTSRFTLTKPVIAAVNGAAIGGGFELALACDLIIAHERATFALPEAKVGLAALAGGLQRLPREIGLKRAMGMVLTGRRATAREGVDWGFVNEATSEDVLLVARRWAMRLLECSPLSLRATKQMVLKGLEEPLEATQTAQWNYRAVKAMLDSQDAIEGPRAFVEKRPAIWTGR